MTDQFSQEYIDYILSDEAKCLQEKWEPKVGDWYTHIKHGEVMLVELEDYRVFQDQPSLSRSYWYLPTLWDLLQIIEGAGYRWEISKYLTKNCYRAYAENLTAEDYPDEVGSDIMLAAAKLAMRAVHES